MMKVPQIKRMENVEPSLHPVGRFECNAPDWGVIKRNRSGEMWVLRGTVTTEHGKLWITYSGIPNTLQFIKFFTPAIDTEFWVSVEHVVYQGRMFASAHLIVPWDSEP